MDKKCKTCMHNVGTIIGAGKEYAKCNCTDYCISYSKYKPRIRLEVAKDKALDADTLQKLAVAYESITKCDIEAVTVYGIKLSIEVFRATFKDCLISNNQTNGNVRVFEKIVSDVTFYCEVVIGTEPWCKGGLVL